MNIFKAYVRYIKDNPEGYWFRRKLYGWGWTPATREGWAVTIIFLLFALGLAIRSEKIGLTDERIVKELLLPIAVAVIILVYICFKTGEPPKWQWRIPEKYKED